MVFVSREALIQSGPGCGFDCETVAPEATSYQTSVHSGSFESGESPVGEGW